jgi:hypothetical protein
LAISSSSRLSSDGSSSLTAESSPSSSPFVISISFLFVSSSVSISASFSWVYRHCFCSSWVSLLSSTYRGGLAFGSTVIFW